VSECADGREGESVLLKGRKGYGISQAEGYRWVEGSRIVGKRQRMEWRTRHRLPEKGAITGMGSLAAGTKPGSDSKLELSQPSRPDASRRLARGPQRALGGVGGID